MEASSLQSEVPTWISGLVGMFGVAAAAYVFMNGGNPSTPALRVFNAVGIGLSLFMVYLFYRFVLAVEMVAEKH